MSDSFGVGSQPRFEPPVGVERLDDELAATLVPERDPHGHKGSFGTLVIVAGSLDYAGAALLSGIAAVRSGAGLVCLAVPASLQPTLAGRVPELITLGLPETAAGEVEPADAVEAVLARQPDALLVGPGLRAGAPTRELVRLVLAGEGSPAVVDAEALNSLAAEETWWEQAPRPAVLTPHPGEFARLDGSAVADDDEVRAERARTAASRWGKVVVLKGAHTVIADPAAEAAMAGFENPALATGGTGDVLAGTIASLLAQGVAPFDAARLGVQLHGRAAEHISERLGDAGLAASDLPLEIARVRRHLTQLHRRAAGRGRLGFAPLRAGG